MKLVVYLVVGIFILLDIITGLIKALYQGNMDSTILRKGLFHKLSEAIATGCAGLFEYLANYFEFGFELPLVKVVAGYICLMEFMSVCENLAEVNPALRKLFEPYLGKLKGGKDEDGD